VDALLFLLEYHPVDPCPIDVEFPELALLLI
jgi:hypothetical protein